MEIRGLNNREELSDLFKMYRKVFKITPLSYFVNRLLNDPYFLPQDVRVAVIDNMIVSSITIYRRQMYWRGKVITFGGIGNVSTLPEYSGKGISSKVMEDAINYMQDQDFSVTILFTGINAFYERFGFKTLPAQYAKFAIPNISTQKYTIRNYKESDFTASRDLYENFNKHLSGSLVRDNEYWAANFKFAEKNELFLIAESHSINAYIRFVPNDKKGDIWEFAYSDFSAFLEILYHFSKRFNKKIINSSALIPKSLSNGNNIKMIVDDELTNIVMYKNLAHSYKNVLNEHTDYCFWWTDNF